jgi:hypothetical protein
MATSLVLHALAAGAIVSLLPAARKPPEEPVRLVFVDALPPPRAVLTEAGRSVALSPESAAAATPEPQVPPRPEAQAPPPGPLGEPAKARERPGELTRTSTRPAPARRRARSKKQPTESVAGSAAAPATFDAAAPSPRATGLPGGVGARVYGSSTI